MGIGVIRAGRSGAMRENVKRRDDLCVVCGLSESDHRQGSFAPACGSFRARSYRCADCGCLEKEHPVWGLCDSYRVE